MTDQEIYDGLKQGDAATMRYLFRKYGRSFIAYVQQNSGDEADGKYLFHLTTLKIWENIERQTYVLTNSTFEAYFWAVAKNLWLYELRQRKSRSWDILDAAYDIAEADDTDDLLYKIAADERIIAIFKVLESWEDTICKDLLTAFHLNEESLLAIAKRLDMNYNNLRKRIHDCRLKMKRLALAFLRQQKRGNFPTTGLLSIFK